MKRIFLLYKEEKKAFQILLCKFKREKYILPADRNMIKRVIFLPDFLGERAWIVLNLVFLLFIANYVLFVCYCCCCCCVTCLSLLLLYGTRKVQYNKPFCTV